MTPAAGAEASYAAIAAAIDAGERTYLRRRALLDGPEATGSAFVTLVAHDLADRTAACGAGFELWALANLGRLKRITLNACALLALQGGRWSAAEHFAREVTARDHHDLMAQRLVDAALEQTPDLQTAIDRWLADRTCTAPFRQIETRTNRAVHFCCSAWQPVPIGAIREVDETGGAETFWTSAAAQEIRRSVTEGDFSYCSRWHCPAIANRRLPRNPQRSGPGEHRPISAVPARPVPDAGRGPKRIILSHDRSCNILCPSCRTKLILANQDSSRELDKLFRLSLLPLLHEAEDIKVTGSGDPFGSRHFRQVLLMLCSQGPPRRRIQLHTNGLLANEKAWDDLRLWNNISSVWVSIDASTAETYAVLRRGGEFSQLLRNLRFLGALRRANAIDQLRLDFVVQQRNYDEIGDFVDLADRVDADGVYFLRLRNWGHFTADDFRKLDVCDPEHPEHSRLLMRMEDPRLARPGVDLGSLASLRRFAPRSHEHCIG